MKSFKHMLFYCVLAVATPAFADDAPGLIEREIPAAHHGRNMQIAVWYPAPAGASELFADNPVFLGSEVRRDANPASGRHPLILLSHGMGGTYLSLNWLATGLAVNGAIVVSVNHPNGWFRDRQPDKMFNHWTRVQDLQVALDYVLADKKLADTVDPTRIYAAGFSFGGWTALSIGGATADIEGSLDYCKAAGTRSHNCTDLKFYGLDPSKVNQAKWTASYKDPRVKAVASIEPGLTWGMKAENVRDLDQSHLLIIGLGEGDDRHYATDTSVRGSGLDQLVPKAAIEVLAPATHFTAMPLCKPAGADILASEKDDPVCTDPQGTDRAAVHGKIIALLAKHFALTQD
jgi:predicted dienelactone hydrolase